MGLVGGNPAVNAALAHLPLPTINSDMDDLGDGIDGLWARFTLVLSGQHLRDYLVTKKGIGRGLFLGVACLFHFFFLLCKVV
jgi:hypothetical protein